MSRPATTADVAAAASPGEGSAQRRSDVRVRDAVALYVGRIGAPMVRCAGVDYSGSGVQAQVEGLELEPGEEVELFMRMPNGVEIEVRALVVRCDDDRLTALQFLGLDSYVRDSLIRQVFVVQRRALAETGRAT